MDTIQSTAAAREYEDTLIAEIEQHTGLATAKQMTKNIEAAKEALANNIDTANKNVSYGIGGALENAGYGKKGSVYERNAIVDATLFGSETEHQVIEGYRYFKTPDFKEGVDLSEASLRTLSGEMIRARVNLAMKNLQKYMTVIFGGEKETDETKKLDWLDNSGLEDISFLAYAQNQWTKFATSAQYNDKEKDSDKYKYRDISGLFNMHIGYAPVMKDDNPEEVDKAGYGEQGRIFELFFRNEAKQGRGLAMLTAPFYDKPMWDSDSDNDGKPDSFLAAPTIRSLADVAVGVVATACTGGMGALGFLAAAGINLADDAVFALGDVANGRMSGGEAAWSLFTKGASSVVSGAIGGAFSGFSGAEGALGKGLIGNIADTGAGSVIAKTVLKGMELGYTSLATSAIGSIEYTDEGGFGFNSDRFHEGLVGTNAVAGYVSGMTGTAVNNSMSYLMTDGIDLKGFNLKVGIDDQALSAFKGAVSGIAGEAAAYAIDQDFAVNVLNWADLTGDYSRAAGLLELHIGMNDGQPVFRSQIGSGGAALNLGAWSRAINESFRLQGIQRDIDLGSERRDYLNGIHGRVIGLNEIGFNGTSEVSEALLSQLDQTRIGSSVRNANEYMARQNGVVSSGILAEGGQWYIQGAGALTREGLENSRVARSLENARAYISGRTDVISRTEFAENGNWYIDGTSNAAEFARFGIENTRSLRSHDNLLAMFAKDSNGQYTHAESYIDSQLALAFGQNDIGVDEFMDNGDFDTAGSFELAHKLYQENKIDLERMFDSDKIHAGLIGNFNDPKAVANVKLQLFNEYMRDQIVQAEGLMMNQIVDPNYRAYKHEEHFMDRIMNNMTRAIGAEVSQVIGLQELFDKAIAMDRYKSNNDAGSYLSMLDDLKQTGVLNDNILDPYMFGGGMERRLLYASNRRNAEKWVLDNKYVYLQRLTEKGAEYICFDPDTMLASDKNATVFGIFRPEVDGQSIDMWVGGSAAETGKYAWREGSALLYMNDMTSAEWIELRNNFYVLRDKTAAYNAMKADMAGKLSALYKKEHGNTTANILGGTNEAKLTNGMNELIALNAKAADNVTTYCNFNQSVYNVAYTGNTLFQDGRGFVTWMADLNSGAFDDKNGRFVEVTEAYAGYWGANNGLAFAIEPTHVSPIVGYERDKWGNITTAYENNVGQEFGYKAGSNGFKGFTTIRSFGENRKPNTKYYIYVPF